MYNVYMYTVSAISVFFYTYVCIFCFDLTICWDWNSNVFHHLFHTNCTMHMYIYMYDLRRTKRMVVDVLKVQPGDNLTEILYTPASPEQVKCKCACLIPNPKLSPYVCFHAHCTCACTCTYVYCTSYMYMYLPSANPFTDVRVTNKCVLCDNRKRNISS